MKIEELILIPTIQDMLEINTDKEITPNIRACLEKMETVYYEKGEIIVAYGAKPDDGMYIIIQGTAGVLNKDGENINEMSSGECVGELALLKDNTRGATVYAKTKVECIRITKSLFREICSANVDVYTTFIDKIYDKTTKMVAERERIKFELEVATNIQMSTLVKDFTKFNQLPNIEFTANSDPAKEVGGDFYDVFMIDENQMCFLIADVSGKGVPAALFMIMTKIHLKNYITLGMPLEEVAYRVNNQLCENNNENMFVTAFICVLNFKTDIVSFINAGHNKPYISKKGSLFTMLEAKVNLVFGVMEDVPYKLQQITLEKGDEIYLYTDGVTEAVNIKNELFSEERLELVLNYKYHQQRTVTEVTTKMLEAVNQFSTGVPQTDDITMIFLSRK